MHIYSTVHHRLARMKKVALTLIAQQLKDDDLKEHPWNGGETMDDVGFDRIYTLQFHVRTL